MVNGQVLIEIGSQQAWQSAKSMEFMMRNLDRIFEYLPKDRHVRDIHRQLVYDSSYIYNSLHEELEMVSISNSKLDAI